jgi:hypothetical protein
MRGIVERLSAASESGVIANAKSPVLAIAEKLGRRHRCLVRVDLRGMGDIVFVIGLADHQIDGLPEFSGESVKP